MLLILAPQSGAVRIHLTNAHNKPVPNHEIWLAETNSTKPVRPFGIQWFIPSEKFHGTTDKNGNAAISGVPLRKPMMVVVRFGPRFDAFVNKNGNASGASLDVMKFEGAVYAGKSAHLILANDREISGIVADAAGKPMKGVEVTLSDTGFGHMGGYPGTNLDLKKTDERGTYRFTRLPNCEFLLFAYAGEHTAVESRPDKGRWNLIATIGQSWSSESVLTDKPKTTCDFRIYQTSHLTVKFKGTAAELKGWTAWAGRKEPTTTGQDIGYNASSNIVNWDVLPGLVKIWLERDRGEIWLVVKRLTLKPGESRTVEVVMQDVLKRKSKS